MLYRLFYLVFILISLTACARDLPAETSTPVSSPTVLTVLTVTPHVSPEVTRTPTATPEIAPTKMVPIGDLATTLAMLAEELVAANCFGPGSPWVATTDNHLEIGCAVSAGHSVSVRLTRFATISEAEQTFHDKAGEGQIEEFHEYSLAAWHQRDPANPTHDGRRGWVWRAECWLVEASAYNDTNHLTADPRGPSEMIYQKLTDYSLLAYCGEEE